LGVAASYDDPYGSPEGEATPPTFGYNGELQDAATGLQNLRARTYNPMTGQFLTRDPLEQQTGQAYLYAGGDPVNGSDPSGQCMVRRVTLPGGGSGTCTPSFITSYVKGTASRPHAVRPLTVAERDCIAQTVMREGGVGVADVGTQEAVGAGAAEVGVAPAAAGEAAGGGGLGAGAGLGLGTLAAGTAIGVAIIGVGVVTFVELSQADDLYAPETRSQCVYNGQVQATCAEAGTSTNTLPLPVPSVTIPSPADIDTAKRDPKARIWRAISTDPNRASFNFKPGRRDKDGLSGTRGGVTPFWTDPGLWLTQSFGRPPSASDEVVAATETAIRGAGFEVG